VILFYFRANFLIFSFLLTCCIVFAQGPATSKPQPDTALVKLFDKPADIKWMKKFRGRMDDATVVDISLGLNKNGSTLVGYLTYQRSNQRIRLQGVFEDSTRFKIEERDGAKNVLGRLVGTYKDRMLEAEWTNADNTLGWDLEAREVPPGGTLNLTCGDNKWANRYLGRYNDKRVELTVVRMHHGSLHGFLWVEADGKTYRLKGEINREGDYEITAALINGKQAAILSGNLKNPKITDCNWIGSGERRSFKLNMAQSLLFGCYDYADYQTNYDGIYPRTTCTNCNNWLDQQMKTWADGCKASFNAQIKPNGPTNRSAHRASAWPEITAWTDNLFCGYMTFTDTWSEQAQGMAFNFDLRTGKNIVYDDLFAKGFNAKYWLDDYVKKELPKMPQYASDPKYKEWIDKEGFPQFTVRREGLELSTLFHPRYGRQAILVPYAQLRANFRKDNPIIEFLKQ
jgi:hypothetical protein